MAYTLINLILTIEGTEHSNLVFKSIANKAVSQDLDGGNYSRTLQRESQSGRAVLFAVYNY